MNTLKKIALSASVLTLGTGFVSLAADVEAAVSGNSEYVQNVNLDFPGYAAVINVRNVSGNKLASAVKLEAQETDIEIDTETTTHCAKDKKIGGGGTRIYFGPVSMKASGYVDISKTLHSAPNGGSYKSWYGATKGWMLQGDSSGKYNAPLASLKNGPASLRLDPIEAINKLLQVHLLDGGTKAEFFKKDHQVIVKRPISGVGFCKKGNSKKAGFETKDFTIQIRYKADPAVYDTPQLNAALGQQNNQQIDSNSPFKIEGFEFQQNIPAYVGKCAPQQGPKIRLNFQVSDKGKGKIWLRVKPGSNAYVGYPLYFAQGPIVHEAAQGNGQLDFEFPLKDILTKAQYAYMKTPTNKTHQHNMIIQARYKGENDDQASVWKDYDTAVFKHRCTGNAFVGGKSSFANGGGNPGPKPLHAKPTAKPIPEKPNPIPGPTPPKPNPSPFTQKK